MTTNLIINLLASAIELAQRGNARFAAANARWAATELGRLDRQLIEQSAADSAAKKKT